MSSYCNNLHDEAPCWCVPAEYIRPRFFYGQRLGVVDFSDWLWYHAGKQRFHNLTSHGVGVLCGLRAELYHRPGEETTTLLTVTRGAAYDACGREVIVPVNQCVDVAAWFLQHQEDADLVDWIESDTHRLYVGLRYLECPSDPAPAPRDPCGCDVGGCEYARVREGFQLRLFPATAMPVAPTVASCQPYHDLLQVLATGTQTPGDACTALQQVLHGLAPAECPPPSGDGWLWLACFDVTLGTQNGQVSAIDEPDNAITQRLELLSTGALQEMIRGVARDAGLGSAGPRISGIAFDGSALQLGIALYAGTALASDTVNLDFFGLQSFQGSAWSPVAVAGAEYDSEDRHITITLSGNFSAGMYRLTVVSPPEAPIVDTAMRPLLPLTYACNFELVQEEGSPLSLNPLFG